MSARFKTLRFVIFFPFFFFFPLFFLFFLFSQQINTTQHIKKKHPLENNKDGKHED